MSASSSPDSSSLKLERRRERSPAFAQDAGGGLFVVPETVGGGGRVQLFQAGFGSLGVKAPPEEGDGTVRFLAQFFDLGAHGAG